jgi:ribonuclease BN (tRNA processing enzyme)
MNSALTLLPLGTGDAFSAEHHSCCSVLLYDGAALLIDCPHPIRKVLHDARAPGGLHVDIGDLSACVLTHLHGDHASGVEGLLWFARFALDKKMTLALHPEVRARLWQHHLAASMDQLLLPDGTFQQLTLADVADCLALDEACAVSVGPFVIEVRRTVHHIPTFALRIRAGQRSIAFSADTAHDPTLIEWLLAADLVVHEAGFGHAHTPYEHLAALPAAARSKMRLTHLPDSFARETSAIACLVEGVPVEV